MNDDQRRGRAEHLVRDLPELMTATEVKDFFRISRSTLGLWLKDPEYLPGAIKIGRDWRIPKQDVIDLALKLYSDTRAEIEAEENGTT
ncbi:helix-turn-helix DNA binding domain protein [Gordonia phage Jumbo]|uniref:Helix-turn-helix DNA binding domain protein n=1 Tax=Gordonia phage Jumbo TaxID=1887650 RepID=A0A1B3B0S4_9CAUD|nr:HTH DNA binding protein [Gordonia phage Jumbo]AOE44613.1 helix-turn-helix DNA binding domain protein [Gordonia phage Jumbo]